MRKLLAILLLALPLHAAEIYVHAAASLADAVAELGAAYERATGTKVRTNFVASNVAARQIEAGAPADLFISADEPLMNELEMQHLVDAETRVVLLTNSLVVIVPADSSLDIGRVSDLIRAERIAIGDPAGVPAGVYARTYLHRVHLWTQLQSHLIPAANVRAVLAAVAAGNADAGFVYRTDAMSSPRVRVAFAAPGIPVRYHAAVLAGAKEPAEAQRFLAMLRSRAAQVVFAKYGFGSPWSRE